MSTTKKYTEKEIVDIVDNLEKVTHLLSYISSTLILWKMDTIFPGNLIKNSCDEWYDKISNLLSKSHSK